MLYTFFYQMILNAKLDDNKIKERKKKRSNRTLTKLDLKQDKKKTRKRYTRK